MKWQPIETAPKDGTGVLLFIPENAHDGCGGFKVAFWSDPSVGDTSLDEAGWYDWEGAGNTIFGQPTHWMPLPEPPQGTSFKTYWDEERGCMVTEEVPEPYPAPPMS